MIPNFEFFGKVFSAYMLLALAGVLTVLLFSYKLAKKNQLDEFHMLYMLLFSFIGAVLGGHILYGITNLDKLWHMLANFSEITSIRAFFANIQVIFGGSVFYGGLLGALFVSFLYMRRKKLPMDAYADIGALAIPLFHTFGRMGCFLSGCCYGIACPVGVTYHYALIPSANGVTRFPVQLVEAVCNLLLFGVLFYLYRNRRQKGRLLGLYLITYSIYRFILEFFRGDTYRGHIGFFSTSQIISLLLLLSASIYFIRAKVSVHTA